jgi:hypothetical protein
MPGVALPRQTGNRSREFPALPVHKLWITGA